MSTFADLDGILVVTPIRLPIRGKTYEFPGTITARAGLLLHRMSIAAEKAQADVKAGKVKAADLAKEALSDGEEIDLRAEVMGDVEREMADDGLTSAHVHHVFQTLLVWHMAGEKAAEKAWVELGEVQAPNRAARRASKGSASTTKRPASTSGTSTRTSELKTA